MKNIIKSILSIVVVVFMWISFSLGIWWETNQDADFPFMGIEDYDESSSWKSDLGNRVDIKEHEDSIITRLLDVFHLDILKYNDHKFLNYVNAILNISLGVLSLVALIMTIYTFYMMLFTENEAWIKKAKWNLIGIFIALAIIGLAWIIVSFIFRWYQNNWEGRREDIETGNITMINYELSNQIYLTA